MNTLRFAQHAKQVQTSAKTTRISEHSMLQECLRTIADLQSKVREKDDVRQSLHSKAGILKHFYSKRLKHTCAWHD